MSDAAGTAPTGPTDPQAAAPDGGGAGGGAGEGAETVETPVAAPADAGPALRLDFSAISDVGRVRKDNQDSGYAGPWLLTVCDGVGGAARGDIASSTAVSAIRALDADPGGTPNGGGLLGQVTDALHEAHVQIGRLVDEDPSINGTSTTATVALFDGHRTGIGHVGDSRAYLFRDDEISQLTTDHTFVQSLIDEGRITEEEARTHPHRNLILKALDGVHEAEPDLFVLELVAGDRLLLCSDGASGVLDDGRLADILSMGTPDFAAVELVRASLEAGSSDNVTCIVADVVPTDATTDDGTPLVPADPEPLLVGAAAELKRRLPRGLFRGHRSGDTGELEPVDAEIPEHLGFAVASDPLPPLDPEESRYAPVAPPRNRWLRRLLATLTVLGLAWLALAAAWTWVQAQYYVGERDGVVVIYHGVDASLPGLPLSEVVVETTLRTDELEDFDRNEVESTIAVADLTEARATVERLAAQRMSGTDSSTDFGTGTTDQTPAG